MAFTLTAVLGILVFAAYLFGGICDAVCGGGGLITVPVLMSIGMPAHMVVGTNQCAMVLGCWTSLTEYAKAGKVNMRVDKIALPCSLVGALIGSRLNLILSEHYLQLVMIILIPILAIFSIVKGDIGEENHSDELSDRRMMICSGAIGLVISMYHGFYGPGSGVFFLVLFVAVLKLDAVTANGTARLIYSCINVVTSTVYALSGNVAWKSVIFGTIGYIVGNYIGTKIAISKGAKIIRPLYYCVLAGLMIKLITSLF